MIPHKFHSWRELFRRGLRTKLQDAPLQRCAHSTTPVPFQFGDNTAPKEHPSSDSNPKSTTSVVQSTSTSSSYKQWAGEIFNGWWPSDDYISTNWGWTFSLAYNPQ